MGGEKVKLFVSDDATQLLLHADKHPEVLEIAVPINGWTPQRFVRAIKELYDHEFIADVEEGR